MSAITIEKRGRRHYIQGNTYAIKDRLRDAGCKWDPDARAWWTGKAEVAEQFAGNAAPAERAKPTREELADRRCDGKVEYKGRTYYVIGRSQNTGKLWLTVLDCSIDFWADESACKWVKRYEGREERGAYGRPTGRTVYQTVGKIRDFVEREKRERSAGAEVCAECGRTGNLVTDLEDGLRKHRGCCDIPPC